MILQYFFYTVMIRVLLCPSLFSLILSFTLFLPLSLHLSFFFFSPSPSLFLTLCVSQSLPFSRSLSLSPPFSLSLFLSLSLSFSHTHTLSQTISMPGESIGNEDAMKVAQFYEKNDFGKAGRYPISAIIITQTDIITETDNHNHRDNHNHSKCILTISFPSLILPSQFNLTFCCLLSE